MNEVRRQQAPPASTPRRSVLLALTVMAVVITAWVVVLGQATRPLPDLVEIGVRAADFFGDLLGASTDQTPAWATRPGWQAVMGLAVDTVVMSVIAMTLAGLGAVVTMRPAARSFTLGEFGPRSRSLAWSLMILFRGFHALARAVPELIWAMLIVFVVRPGILAGALALALHEFGVLGRLASDVTDDLDPAPLRALRTSGAGGTMTLHYGVLPQALPQLLTFLLYRWEVCIRATVIVGFVTSAGLGHKLRLDLSFRRWTEVALVLLVYVLTVWTVEVIASGLRKLAR